MSELERIEGQIHELDKRQSNFETYTRLYINKLDEMIRLQREETTRIREEMREDRQELKAISKHTQNLILATLASMGTLTVAVIGFIWTMATR